MFILASCTFHRVIWPPDRPNNCNRRNFARTQAIFTRIGLLDACESTECRRRNMCSVSRLSYTLSGFWRRIFGRNFLIYRPIWMGPSAISLDTLGASANDPKIPPLCLLPRFCHSSLFSGLGCARKWPHKKIFPRSSSYSSTLWVIGFSDDLWGQISSSRQLRLAQLAASAVGGSSGRRQAWRVSQTCSISDDLGTLASRPKHSNCQLNPKILAFMITIAIIQHAMNQNWLFLLEFL